MTCIGYNQEKSTLSFFLCLHHSLPTCFCFVHAHFKFFSFMLNFDTRLRRFFMPRLKRI